jgi:hypothetical protein
MHASAARTISTEAWYFKQIRREAELGKDSTTFEFTDQVTAMKVKKALVEMEYNCGRIKQHSDMMGDDFTMEVSW